MRPMTSGLTSFVTLNWEHYSDLTGPFIRFIDTWVPEPKELIVVDQGSGTRDREKLVEDARRFDWLRVVLLDQNVGFPAGCNAGTHEAAGEFIVQINNDIIVHGEFLAPVLGKLRELRENPRRLIGASLIQRGGWNEYPVDGTSVTIPYLEGWLLAMHRDAVEEIGLFDEAFGIGSLEDVEFCWRAARAGYELVQVTGLPLQHLRGATVMDGRLEQLKISQQNFELMKHRVAEYYAQEGI